MQNNKQGDRVRDSQRSKLYRAENILRDDGKQEMTLAEIEHYVRKLLGSAYIKRNYKVLDAYPTIVDGRGRRSAYAFPSIWNARLGFPRWSRFELIVLHETAHLLTNWTYGYRTAWHGWEFAWVLLDLVRHRMGKEAEAKLKASFRENGVRWTARKKRILTEEQREVLRQRIAVARQVKQARQAAA